MSATYKVTGHPPDDRVSPWTNVSDQTSIGDYLTLTLSSDDEALLIAAGVLSLVNLPSVASAATVSPTGRAALLVTGTTGITDITAGNPGDTLVLVFAGILTVTDGSNLKLSGDMTTSADDTLSLVCDGTNWYETARSAN